ncbi:MAG: cytochrome-c peroxidase [Saprospirales bacterium]|nr:cytochrome-c peroxidase [Saprospirales bacterium]
MKIHVTLLCAGFILTAMGCAKDNSANDLNLQLLDALDAASGGKGSAYYILPASDRLEQIPQDPNNPLSTYKVKLGQLLYHETALGLAPMHAENMEAYSCASCHFAAAGFQAGRHQGISDGGVGFFNRTKNGDYTATEVDVQPIRTPSVLNTAYQQVMLWNGQFGAVGLNAGTQDSWTAGTPKETNNLGYEGLETQAIAGLNVHRMMIEKPFITTSSYGVLFDAAFPDVPVSERYTRQTAGLAIGAFERTVLANKAPFQDWLRGKYTAMTEEEKRGALLFFGKAECASCHNGPSLANMEFDAIGMEDLYLCPEPTFKSDENSVENKGRGGFTNNPADNYKFKVPQLYNLADSPYYGHGASFRSIRAVVEYLNAGVSENPAVPSSQLASGFKPLGLTSKEVSDITAFLEHALYDPDLMRYQPTFIVSGNCFPNNDPQSRADLGCD